MKARKISSYYWPFIKKYKKTILVTFLAFGIARVLQSVLVPFIYKDIVDVVSHADLSSQTAEILMRLVIYLAILLFSVQALFRLGGVTLIFAQSNILRELADYSFKKLQNHSYRFFTENFSGGLVAKTKRFIESFEKLQDAIIFRFWMTIVHLIGTFIALFYLNSILGLIFFFWCLVYLASTFFFVKRKIPYDLKLASADSKVTSRLSDVITNILTIKMFAKSSQEYQVFSRVTAQEETVRRSAWLFGMLAHAVQGLLIAILEVAGMYLAISFWLSGEISSGTIVLVQLYFTSIFLSIWNLGEAITNFTKSLTDADEMVKIFKKKPEILDPLKPEACRITKGEILFKNIFFKYKNGAKVFSNFSLSIPAGQKVGLVGPSGMGKTTITKLLLRFILPQKGMITIDGQDIAKISQEDLRQKIAYVPQEPTLFHRSLKENITYANEKISTKEMLQVAKKAHVHQFVKQLEKKYKTKVGERGVKLSGGERQRVAIARAIVKDAPILILDEATSSLDSIGEKHLQKALNKLMEGKTTIAIAHRLSTIQQMDRILVLDDQGIVEEGTHRELLKRKGLYFRLWQEQTGKYID